MAFLGIAKARGGDPSGPPSAPVLAAPDAAVKKSSWAAAAAAEAAVGVAPFLGMADADEEEKSAEVKEDGADAEDDEEKDEEKEAEGEGAEEEGPPPSWSAQSSADSLRTFFTATRFSSRSSSCLRTQWVMDG